MLTYDLEADGLARPRKHQQLHALYSTVRAVPQAPDPRLREQPLPQTQGGHQQQRHAATPHHGRSSRHQIHHSHHWQPALAHALMKPQPYMGAGVGDSEHLGAKGAHLEEPRLATRGSGEIPTLEAEEGSLPGPGCSCSEICLHPDFPPSSWGLMLAQLSDPSLEVGRRDSSGMDEAAGRQRGSVQAPRRPFRALSGSPGPPVCTGGSGP